MTKTLIIPGLDGSPAGPGTGPNRQSIRFRQMDAPRLSRSANTGVPRHANVTKGQGPWPEALRLRDALRAESTRFPANTQSSDLTLERTA